MLADGMSSNGQRSLNPHQRCVASLLFVRCVRRRVQPRYQARLCLFLVDGSVGSSGPVLMPAGRVPKTHATVAYMRALQEREPDWEERINQVLLASRLGQGTFQDFWSVMLRADMHAHPVCSANKPSALIRAGSGVQSACHR